MTVQEIRQIREKKSVEWADLSLEQRNAEIKTGAKQMQMKIEEIKKKRRNALMALQADIVKETRQKTVGQIITLMVDGQVEDGVYCGRGEQDAYEVDGTVFFSSPEGYSWMSGDLVNVRITAVHGYDLTGEMTGGSNET